MAPNKINSVLTTRSRVKTKTKIIKNFQVLVQKNEDVVYKQKLRPLPHRVNKNSPKSQQNQNIQLKNQRINQRSSLNSAKNQPNLKNSDLAQHLQNQQHSISSKNSQNNNNKNNVLTSSKNVNQKEHNIIQLLPHQMKNSKKLDEKMGNYNFDIRCCVSI